MVFKKFIAMILVVTILFTLAPVTTFAAEESKLETVATNESVEVKDKKDTYEEETDGEITTQGFRKSAVVFALRYGGNALDSIVSVLSKKNGDLVNKHADELADALESFSDSIEARLIDFMIFQLGFPSSSARTIAWAIMLAIG